MTTLTPSTNQTTFNSQVPQWQPATWEDYRGYRDAPTTEKVRLFFNNNYLFVDMGSEGINHASFNNLFTMLLFIWFNRFSEQIASSLGGCLLEKPNKQAASPDLVLYVGENIPQWQEGEPRRIDLNQWRVPDLVGEIADTTLATDLDEKKHLYADLGIPEYWVIDVRGKRVLAFRLEEGTYKQCYESIAIKGLPISLIEQTLEQLIQGTNISAASWFNQAIANLNIN